MSERSLLYNLGAFVGNVWKGVRTDPGAPPVRREVRRETEETDDGTVVLRRTTIEEIHMNARRGDD